MTNISLLSKLDAMIASRQEDRKTVEFVYLRQSLTCEITVLEQARQAVLELRNAVEITKQADTTIAEDFKSADSPTSYFHRGRAYALGAVLALIGESK